MDTIPNRHDIISWRIANGNIRIPTEIPDMAELLEPQAVARWDVLEFRARVVDHIPEPSQQTVRYWGFYANAARDKRRKAAPGRDSAQAARGQDEDEFTRRTRLSWAKLIHRVYEVDPLLCPFCGAEMKVLAFILDFGVAKAIRKSLKLPAQEPEPLAHAPLEAHELIVESD